MSRDMKETFNHHVFYQKKFFFNKVVISIISLVILKKEVQGGGLFQQHPFPKDNSYRLLTMNSLSYHMSLWEV